MYAVFLRGTIFGRISPLYKTKKECERYIKRVLYKKYYNVPIIDFIIMETL